MKKQIHTGRISTFLFLISIIAFFTPLQADESKSLPADLQAKLNLAVSSAFRDARLATIQLPPTSAIITFELISLENPSKILQGKEVYLATMSTLNGEVRALALVSSDASVVEFLYGAQNGTSENLAED